MIRREKYLKTASRRRSTAVKRDQKINANSSIEELEEQVARAEARLAEAKEAALRGFGQPAYALAA